jgi:F0F1-type ATP synthase assembly protein I
MKPPIPHVYGRSEHERLGNDNVGRGVDSAMVMLVFLALGWLLDRWLDTRPIFMVSMVVLGGVGSFVRIVAGYSGRMDRLQADRFAESGRLANAESRTETA